ncbi:MAG: type I restriction enzyme HsdR N-terminal domain-containing protein [Flavobacteriaceae bacterium]
MANIQQITKELKKILSNFDFNRSLELSDNEAKTRMYLVEPFFEALRFNRGFESGNLIPEYNADFGNLNGKKVDYAITYRNKPEIIIEVKKSSTKLNSKHLSQLNEYFNNTNDSKIGILTNGVVYQFYCRNNNGNVGLHPTPIFTFDWSNLESNNFDQLAKFYGTIINIKEIITNAQDLFFIEGFEDALFSEFAQPSRDFVKAIYANMGGNRLSESIEKQIKELINSISIRTALDKLIIDESERANSGIITTHEEMKVFHVIKTILAQHKKIETKSIGYQDYKGKFAIILDGKKNKKVCDLYITPKYQKIEINGDKLDIPDIDSIVKLKKRLTDKALELVEK